MARLDRFIQAMQDNGAESLVLAVGKPVAVQQGGATRPLTRDPLAAALVLALVKEIAPPALQSGITDASMLTFAYIAPAGGVQVQLSPGAEGLLVQVRPDGNGAAPAPVAAADAGAPPPPGRFQRPSVASILPPDLAGPRSQLDQLLRLTAETGSSDLHLRTGEQPIFRRDGELVRQEGEVLEAAHLERMLLSIMGENARGEFVEHGDADWAYELEGVARFRANAARERRGPMGVFRVIPGKILTADELGLPAEVQKLCYLTKGLVVVTGPTGCGKSTTLAALVDLMNRTRSDHILTIEDPIEFVHQPKKCVVTQRQVGLHTRSFKNALRAALREDPDVILVGEMRDLETVSIAIETAETGHLVFGTLHTTTAASTIDRIIDQFPPDRQSQVRVMLSESLRGVIAQVLCRKIGGGRVAAKEVLLSIPAVSNLIREGKTFQIPSIMQTNRKVGMVTLNDALMELV
ncbi:MAG: type IV pilus twitching motility protein PilT, partial [Gemmatimonadota bacterium]